MNVICIKIDFTHYNNLNRNFHCVPKYREANLRYKDIVLVELNSVQEKVSFNTYSFSNNARPNLVNLLVSTW